MSGFQIVNFVLRFTTAVLCMCCDNTTQLASFCKASMGLLPDTQNGGLCMRRECRERFPRHHGLAIPTTSGFLWSRWRGKRSRHSRRMRIPQVCVSGKRPMALSAGAAPFCNQAICNHALNKIIVVWIEPVHQICFQMILLLGNGICFLFVDIHTWKLSEKTRLLYHCIIIIYKNNTYIYYKM